MPTKARPKRKHRPNHGPNHRPDPPNPPNPLPPPERPPSPVPNNTPITFRALLREENLNSRFTFLVMSGLICVSVLILLLGFMLATDKSWYAEMMAVILGGGLANSAGRWLTKPRGRTHIRDFRTGREEEYD